MGTYKAQTERHETSVSLEQFQNARTSDRIRHNTCDIEPLFIIRVPLFVPHQLPAVLTSLGWLFMNC
ncbi:MAG: hypothetical protein U9N09_00125 [Euryarchaeota archaeon]|nr:hypothetical protein [Euryarchaeota archaeon]